MVQPKYSPEEALQRIKLMMEYDMSKTSDENKKVISEQSTNCENSIEYSTVRELADNAGDLCYKMMSPITRMMRNGEERAQEILDAIKQVVGKNTYDDIDETCVPAKGVFEKFFIIGTKGNISKGKPVSVQFNEIMNDSFIKYYTPEAVRIINKAKRIWENNLPPKPDPNKPDPNKPDPNKPDPNKPDPNKPDPNKPDPNKPVQPRYRDCGEGPFTKGCRTTPEGPIGQVQACLKLVQDGKFWNKTQAALVSKGYPNGFTKEDVKTICGNQTKPEEVSSLPQDDELLDVDSM
jgi:hypothetical protein